MVYTSVKGTFTYTITNNTSYVFDSTDYAIIQSAFDRWDNIMTLDSRVGAGYTITINYSVEVLEAGVLGGASIQTVGYIGSLTFGNTFPYEADITLNASYLSGMKNAVRSDGKTSYYYVLLHEIGHILGIGSFWNLPGTPKVSYLDNGVTKYYYTGANALREYKYYFADKGSSSFVGVPIEDNGGAGTVNVHPEEGPEGGVSADNRYINGILHPGLDTELMTGWLDGAPVSTPLSRITLGFLADMGYTVNYNLADLYTMAWLATDNANNLEQTYITGFLDVSGSINHRNGDLNVIDGNLLVTSGNVSLNNGNLYVGGNGVINSGLAVSGSTTLGRVSVSNNMDVSGATNLVGALAISGLTSFNNNVSVSGNKTFTVGTGATTMDGTATLNSTLAVAGGVSMNSGLRVAGATTLTNAIMDGPVSVSGHVAFLNDISFTGQNVDICGNLYARYPANSIPAAAIIGGINVVSSFNNDVSLNQTLSVGGATSLSTLATTGNATLRSTVDIGGATTMSALTTSGATNVGGTLRVVGKAALTNDVSFNVSQIDICGNLYANYPANSIPALAVVGGGEVPVFMTDVSINAMLSVAGATTLQSTLVVSGKTTLASDVSFNGSRIDICGNLYAKYPANSIPSSAIIGGTTVASTFNTDVSMNSRLYVKENIKIGNLATISKTLLASQYGGIFTGTGAYGQSVSISADGSILAIGAWNAGFGQTTVYQKDTTNTTVAPIGWIQLGGTIIGEASGDGAGRSVSVSSDGTNIIVAILAHLADGINGVDTGHVRVYQYEKDKAADTNQNNATFGPLGWKRLGADIDGEAPNDNQLGSGQVSLSVTWPNVFVAIGAPMNDGTATIDNDYRGHVRVYQYVEGKAQDINQNNNTFGPLGWKRLGKDIDGSSIGLYSGTSVSLSKDGSLVAIGFPNNAFVVPYHRGLVRVYQYQSGSNSWTQYGADIIGQAAGDQFGMALSLSADGTILAVCANKNDAAGSESGSVYVYRYSAGTWSQLGSTITGEATLDQDIDYAKNVSVSGNWPDLIVAIGAQKNDGSVTNSNCGHVRIYRYIATTWTKLGNDIDGTTANDEFGKTVSLSSDGSTLAIGTQNGNYVKVYAISNNPYTDVLSTSGLQTAGTATVSGPLAVTGATTLSSTMNASGAASLTALNITGATTLAAMTVSGNATIGGTMLVTGTSSLGVSTINSTFSVGAATTMSTKLVANSDVSLNNKLTVTGATTMNSTLTLAGATTLNNTAFMTSLVTAGAVTLNSTLYVAKSVTINGDIDTSGVLLMSAVTMPSTLTTGGAATLSSQLSVAGATTMRSTLNTSGAVTIGGILSVAGLTTLSGTTNMDGKVSVGSDVSMNSTLIVMNNATLASTLAVVGASTLSSTLYTSGSTTINNTLNVNGKTTFLNDVSFNNNVTTPNTLTVNNNRITIGSSNIQYNAGVGVDSAIIPTAIYATNNATVGGVLTIAGSTTLSSTLVVGGAVTSATVYASSNAILGTTLNVAGAATVGQLTVTDATTVSTLTTTGATTVGGTLGITGASTMATLNVYGPMRQW